jgi:hypothetical protein
METTEATKELTFPDNLVDWRLKNPNIAHYLSAGSIMHRYEHCSGMRVSHRIPPRAVRALWREGVANREREIGWCTCACKVA